MTPIVIEGPCDDTRHEDGGHAFIATVYDEATADQPDGIFVRIQSWSETEPPTHPIAEQITGRRVRITVELLD